MTISTIPNAMPDMPQGQTPLGDALAALGRRLGLTDADWKVITQTHDNAPADPVPLE